MKSKTALVLLAVAASMSSCRDPKPVTKEIRVETPSGTITAEATTEKPTPQVIRKASEEAVTSFHSLAAKAPAFLREYLGAAESPSLAAYDRAFKAWQDSDRPKRTPAEVVDILGAYLGEELNRGLDMEWVTVSDELGSAFAVRHRKFTVVAYPFSSVQKRIDDRSYGFIEKIYYTAKNRLESGDYKENDQR